jgi:signal transduction histidine kinase
MVIQSAVRQQYVIYLRLILNNRSCLMAKIHAIIIPVAYQIIGRVPVKNAVGRQFPPEHRELQGNIDVAFVDIEKTAHDFRSSLGIIIGFSELMLDEVMGKINREQRRSLQDILKNGQHLLDLVDNIDRSRDAGLQHKA